MRWLEVQGMVAKEIPQNSPSVAQECSMVQGCPAKAISLVHISSILQKELTDNQGTLQMQGNQTEPGKDTGRPVHPNLLL